MSADAPGSSPPTGPVVVLRRGAGRPVSAGDGVVSRHALSFGAHYDPERTSFGALVAHNDDVLGPGVAYGAHEHRDVEILAWVVAGTLVHRGPDGRDDTAGAGTLQYLSAGTGWHHDERAGDDAPLHVVQLWLAPGLDDPPPADPELRQVPVDPDAVEVEVAGGDAALVALRRTGVSVRVVRPAAAERWAPGPGRWHHVHVVRGALRTADQVAGPGDDLEVTGEGPVELVAGEAGTELLVVTTR